MHEARSHAENSFITLTYSPNQLPADGGLRIEHWQRFAKRLRKSLGPFRFFHAGEYGKLGRPHYHAAIFGHDFSEDRKVHRRSGKHTLFTSSHLERIWSHGYCSIGNLEPASARYIAKYVTKKYTGDQAESAYTRVNKKTGECWSIRPPYATMSRRPGLGHSYYQKYGAEIHKHGTVRFLDGSEAPIPTYYQKLLSEEDPEAGEAEAKRRRSFFAASPDQTWERLIVREDCAEARKNLHSTQL